MKIRVFDLSNEDHKGVESDNAFRVLVLASMERVAIPLPHNAGPSPLPWTSLAFHPLGLFDLRRRLGKPSLDHYLSRSLQARFEAADLAWFAAGLASQSCNIHQEEFYPELSVLRSNTEKDSKGTEARAALRKRVRDLTFDCSALWDRAFGGTTLVIHVDGTTRPGALKQPEFVKSEVYFPGHLLKEEAGCAEAVYDIVQRFINDIGIPTIGRYERCAKSVWKLPKSTQCPPPLSQHGIFPKALPPNSSCFIYHGRKLVNDDNDIMTPSQHQILTCVENEGFLKAELMLAKGGIGDLETDLADSRRHEQELLVQIEHLTSAGAAPATRNLPHTPNRHRTLALSPTEYGTFFEAHNMDDMFQIKPFTNAGAAPATPRTTPRNLSHTPNCHRTPAFSEKSPQVHSPLRHKTYSTAPTATTEYGMFIENHNLDDMFPAIDLVRRKVTMYLWRDELLSAGVPEDLLPQLMAVMSSHSESNPSSSSPFV